MQLYFIKYNNLMYLANLVIYMYEYQSNSIRITYTYIITEHVKPTRDKTIMES